MNKQKPPNTKGQRPNTKVQQQKINTELVPSFTTCFHLPENEAFYSTEKLPPLHKKNCKTPANQNVPTAVGRCEICAAYGLQAVWRWATSKSLILSGNEEVISKDDYERGRKHLPSYFQLKRSLVDNKEGAPGIFNLGLDRNQFGETFHLLISAFLAPASIHIKLDDASDQQKELLHYYFNDNNAASVLELVPGPNTGSKASATDTTSYVFENAKNAPNQADVFRYIRDFMDMGRLAKEPFNNKYASPFRGIIAANCVAQLNGPDANLFSHITLYGDLSLEEAEGTIKKVENWLNNKKKLDMTIKILYITFSWRANFKGEKGSFLGGERGGDVDGIPYQVKVIGIYLALQARYGNKLCYIGARSGFLETAAFLGSPVFYYNETNYINFKKTQRYDDGTVLWDGPRTRSLYKGNRMGRAVDALNTLICIDLTNVVQDAENNTKAVFVKEQGKKQLAAVLYMFMLAHKSSGASGPMWEEHAARRRPEGKGFPEG
ncbi:hypothetical protein GGR58DRAFT_514308 [Xylaria digitata]|nr:hypothetical protein GGR58DRAFT_514308 [Xylaria digitata]